MHLIAQSHRLAAQGQCRDYSAVRQPSAFRDAYHPFLCIHAYRLILHICFTLVSFEGSFMRYGFPKEFGGVCRAVCHGRGM